MSKTVGETTFTKTIFSPFQFHLTHQWPFSSKRRTKITNAVLIWLIRHQQTWTKHLPKSFQIFPRVFFEVFSGL